MARLWVARLDARSAPDPAPGGLGGFAFALAPAIALALVLSGCASAPQGPALPAPAAPPVVAAVESGAAPAAETAAQAAAPADGPADARPGRWWPAGWDELPGWSQDAVQQAWPALLAGCVRPAAEWAALCARLARFAPPDDGFAREFLERELRPWRITTASGSPSGLATGYFEPLLEASRRAQPDFPVPLYRLPPTWARDNPGFTRQALATDPAARAALSGHEIAWVASELDALVLQVQGSGRLNVREPDGRSRWVRLAYGGHNGQPYASVGRWLIQQGEMTAEQASWPAIRAWAERASPLRRQAMLFANPRVVFFRELPLVDPSEGPRGAQGVPLTAGRSAAVDPRSIPYGTPLWVDTTEPLSSRPLQRLVMAQDTGSAIVGAVRIDLFFGTGEAAAQQAGRMKQALRLWALWPRNSAPRQLAQAGAAGPDGASGPGQVATRVR